MGRGRSKRACIVPECLLCSVSNRSASFRALKLAVKCLFTPFQFSLAPFSKTVPFRSDENAFAYKTKCSGKMEQTSILDATI